MAAYKEFGFEGRTAIITGAGTGMGEAVAVELARSGAKVALFGRRLEKLEGVRDKCLEHTKDVICLSTDVRDREQVNDNVAKVLKSFGKIDILINNAGFESKLKPGETYFGTLFDKMTDEEYLDFFRTHALGHYHMNLACIPSMKEHRFGRIVNNASICGISGNFSTPAYCASKAAAICQTKSFAIKYGVDGIIVNATAEGYVDTPMNAYFTQEGRDAIAKRTLVGRAAEPIDIVRVILFLAQENLFMTGQCIVCDGGSSLR
jgi:NAD(P)-dependent dehydrogenase (short-subunit alcohol dehydrogenase family)